MIFIKEDTLYLYSYTRFNGIINLYIVLNFFSYFSILN
ncbi:hypothetical protein CUZ91_2805 [Enterococcus xinjiangensis]|nr:hypothetical protein [Enterococcus lactis]